MNTDLFNQLTLPEKVVLIPLKGRFVAERHDKNQLVKLYHWSDVFVEIYYRCSNARGRGANWEPSRVNSFADGSCSSGYLFPYVDQLSLEDILP